MMGAMMEVWHYVTEESVVTVLFVVAHGIVLRSNKAIPHVLTPRVTTNMHSKLMTKPTDAYEQTKHVHVGLPDANK